MNKVYNRINWENYPSDKTPLNEQNLNKIDVALNEADNRVITLDETKAAKTEIAPLIKEISFDESNGIFTITRKNGSKFTIDTKLEKIAINFDYDPATQKISLTLIDGTIQYIDLSALITEYEFLDTDTVSFFVNESGKVSAIVKEGSIEEEHLRPDYLAEIKVEVSKAEASATAAEVSKAAAENFASEASAKANEASISAANALKNAEISSQKAEEASLSEKNAANSATISSNSAIASTNKAEEAAVSSASAANAASTATDKANAAFTSATNATTSAVNADTYAKQSQSYAIGGTGTRPGEDTDNSKYYYEQAKHISQGGNGLVPMGTVSFKNLPTIDIINNAMYNISDDFVSDERFIDGGGVFYGKGSNVYYTVDKKWDVLAASSVTGVKGDKESTYQQGNVNITSENIGALPEDGNALSATKATQDENGNNIVETYQTKIGDTNNNIVSFSQSSIRENIFTGEKHSVIFGKIKKWFSDIKNAAFHSVANNLNTTSENYVLDARQGKILDDKFGGMTFGIDANGNYGYIKAGADTVTPFNTKKFEINLLLSADSTVSRVVDVTKFEKYKDFTLDNFFISNCSIGYNYNKYSELYSNILSSYDANNGKLYLSQSTSYADRSGGGYYGYFIRYSVCVIIPA